MDVEIWPENDPEDVSEFVTQRLSVSVDFILIISHSVNLLVDQFVIIAWVAIDMDVIWSDGHHEIVIDLILRGRVKVLLKCVHEEEIYL